jgi:hypothetical protein
MQVESLAHDPVGPGEHRGGVSDLLGEAGGHVAARVYSRPIGAEGVIKRGHGGEGLVLDAERIERVGGLLRALGHHEGHRLPRVRDDLLRQDLRADRHGQARMGHGQGKTRQRGHVGGNEDVNHAGLTPGLRGVDSSETRMRVRAPVHRHVQRTRQGDVGDVATEAGDQPGILAPSHRRAEQPFAHEVSTGAEYRRSGAETGSPPRVACFGEVGKPRRPSPIPARSG